MAGGLDGWRSRLGRLPVLRGVLPAERSRLWPDVLAGVTLAALGVPEVLGYAKIAGMPLVTGLYTMLLPMATFAVLCSSRHLVVAADSATAAILAAALAPMAAAGSERYVRLAGLAALLTGAMLLLARVIRLSFLADFLSRTVLVGFLTGVGIQVAARQLPDMLGVTVTGTGTVTKLAGTARALPHAHWADVAVSAGVIAVVLAIRAVTRRVPGPLIAVGLAIAVSRLADLPAHGVAVIGAVPRGLPSFALPAHEPGRRRGAARRVRVHVRRHPGAERGDRPRLRGQVLRGPQHRRRPDRARRGERRGRLHRDVRRQRQPHQGADGRQRRRPEPAPPAQPPPPWCCSPWCCSPGCSPTCRPRRSRRWCS